MAEINTNIPGWCTFASFYDKIVEKYPSGQYAEVGCFFGQSSVYLLEKIRETNSDIYVSFVDTWLGGTEKYVHDILEKNGSDYIYNEFLKNTKDYANLCNIVRSDSVKAAALYDDETFDFVFIDGEHNGDGCYNDMIAWYPKLKFGGIMAGHDINQPNIQRCVKMFSEECDIFIDEDHSSVEVWSFTK